MPLLYLHKEPAEFEHCMAAYYKEITGAEVEPDQISPVTCNEVVFVTHEASLFAADFTWLALLLSMQAMPCGYLSQGALSSAFHCTDWRRQVDRHGLAVVPTQVTHCGLSQLSHFGHTCARILHTALQAASCYNLH